MIAKSSLPPRGARHDNATVSAKPSIAQAVGGRLKPAEWRRRSARHRQLDHEEQGVVVGDKRRVLNLRRKIANRDSFVRLALIGNAAFDQVAQLLERDWARRQGCPSLDLYHLQVR